MITEALIIGSTLNILVMAILIVKNKLNWAMALGFLQAIVWVLWLWLS